MITRAIWTAGFVLAGFILPATAAERIAVVAVARVIREYQAARAAEERLEERAQEYSAENDALLEQYERLQNEFEELRDASLDAALNDAARETRRRAAEEKLRELADHEGKIRETSALRRRQLEEQRQRAFRALITDIRAAISRQAEQDGYAMALDASVVPGNVGAVLYHQSGQDITAAVIERLNAALAASPEEDKAP